MLNWGHYKAFLYCKIKHLLKPLWYFTYLCANEPNIGKRKIPVEELRLLCGLKPDEYAGYGMLKRKVIEKAKQEINNKTDYDVDYEEIKESRKVVTIEWTIKKEQSPKQSIPPLPKEYRSDLALIEAFGEYGFTRAIAKKILKDHDIEVVKNALKCVNL